MPDRNLIPMRSLPKTVDAKYYNRVRLALLRLDNPLRLSLDTLGSADMILADGEWLCVDRSRDDLPLLAWKDFELKGREGLHQPVQCTLHLYHSHAGMLMGRVLPVMDGILDRRLDAAKAG